MVTTEMAVAGSTVVEAMAEEAISRKTTPNRHKSIHRRVDLPRITHSTISENNLTC
jgi:hypothetical protein